MAANIFIDLDGDFTGVVKAMTTETEKLTEAELTENLARVTKNATNKLKKRSKRRTPGNASYASGWKASKPKPIEGIGVSSVIYNATKPSLTHLLEKGHAKVNGGRVEGDGVIAQVYEEAAREFSAGAL